MVRVSRRQAQTSGKPTPQVVCYSNPQRGLAAFRIDSYLRIWASCRPPPTPQSRQRSRSPTGLSDGAPCSPSRCDPVARTGRSAAAAAAAAPWLRPGGDGASPLPAIGPRPAGPGRDRRLRLARLSWARGVEGELRIKAAASTQPRI